jgi:hypothetical protein
MHGRHATAATLPWKALEGEGRRSAIARRRAALVGGQALQYLLGRWELRGATSLAGFAIVVLALGWVRSAACNEREAPRERGEGAEPRSGEAGDGLELAQSG